LYIVLLYTIADKLEEVKDIDFSVEEDEDAGVNRVLYNHRAHLTCKTSYCWITIKVCHFKHAFDCITAYYMMMVPM
jgi:hypothetical protein